MVCGVSESETISYPPDCVYSQQEIDNKEDGETNTSEVSLIPYSQESEPETPKRVNKLSRKDTPRAERVQETPAYTSSYVDPQREQLIASIGGEVFEETTESFFEHALPPLKSELKIDDIYNACLGRHVLTKDEESDDYKWIGLLDSPSNKELRENDVYNKPLGAIFKEITTIAEELSELKCKSYFHADGNKTYWSEKTTDIKPDALILLKNPNDGYPKKHGGKHWYNAVCSIEFKKADTDKDAYGVITFLLSMVLWCQTDMIFCCRMRGKLYIVCNGYFLMITAVDLLLV